MFPPPPLVGVCVCVHRESSRKCAALFLAFPNRHPPPPAHPRKKTALLLARSFFFPIFCFFAKPSVRTIRFYSPSLCSLSLSLSLHTRSPSSMGSSNLLSSDRTHYFVFHNLSPTLPHPPVFDPPTTTTPPHRYPYSCCIPLSFSVRTASFICLPFFVIYIANEHTTPPSLLPPSSPNKSQRCIFLFLL